MAIGYQGQQMSPVSHEELLLYTQNEMVVTKTILGSTQDPTNPEGATILRPGLVLGKVSASGKYTHWRSGATNGTQHEETAVILRDRIEVDGTNDQPASCLIRGHFNLGMIKFHTPAEASSFVWADMPGYLQS